MVTGGGTGVTHVVAIDLGTTTCKAAAYVDGRLVAEHRRRVTTTYGGRGVAEQDPAEWLRAVSSTTRRVLSLAEFTHVDAISLTAESDSLVLVDAAGDPVRPALLWMDVRGDAQAKQLEATLGRAGLYEATGLRAAGNFTLPKLAWVREHEPELFRRGRWAFQPKDFLFHALTGRALTDPSSAARTLGFDLRTATWSRDVLRALAVPESMLPELAATSSARVGLTADVAARWGLRAGTPVVVGAADRAAEVLGLGVESPRAMVSSGTATGVATAIDLGSRPTDDRIITPSHAVPGQLLALASVPTSGTVLDWLAAVTGLRGASATTRLLREAANAAPGAGGTVSVPSFDGARSLHWQPKARERSSGSGWPPRAATWPERWSRASRRRSRGSSTPSTRACRASTSWCSPAVCTAATSSAS